MNLNIRRDLSEELWRSEGTSLEFCRKWKEAHEARAGWMRETAAQDRVRAVIMGWLTQSFIIQGWFYCQCDQKSLEGWRFSSVQLLSRVQLFETPWTTCSTPGLPVHHQLLKFTQTHVHWVMPSSHLILCRPLLLLPSIFPSIRVFSNESALSIRWLKYWSFSFSPSNEHSGLISFRMDWLDLLSVQGTLRSLLQHHSSKASIHPRSAFFTVQLSHPYMITGKTTALTRRIFVGKVMLTLSNH